jgi:hypothetical protein
VVAAAIRGRTARRVSSSPCLNVVKAALRETAFLETILRVAVRETVFRNMVVVVVVMIK